MNGTMESDEARSGDNFLTLNPNEFPVLEKWEDGNDYSILLKVRQVSPGEFEVTDAKEAPAEPDHDEADANASAPEATEERGQGMSETSTADEFGSTGEPAMGQGYNDNPAIRRMMASSKR